MKTRSRSRLSWNQSNRFLIESLLPNERGIFNIIENSGSGNCLFLSILEFLEHNKEYFKKIPNNAIQLRIRTVDYILSRNSIGFQENWDRFYGNVRFNLDHIIKDLSQYGRNDDKDKEIKKSYRVYMMQAGNCGTFSELYALAEMYGFHGYIFQRDESNNNNFTCYNFGLTSNPKKDKELQSKPALFLLFTGSTKDGHFRLLDPLTVPSFIQSGVYSLVDSFIPTPTGSVSIMIKKTEVNPHDNTSESRGESNIESVPIVSPFQSTSNPPSPQYFVCDVCKKSYATKRGLNIHRNRHAMEANATTVDQLKERLKIPPPKPCTSTKSKDTTEAKAALDSDCKKWQKTFEDFENNDAIDLANFSEKVEGFQEFLFKSNQRLPGPQHPSVKFYKIRQQKKNRKVLSAQQSRSSNPQRTDATVRQRRRDKYQYDLAQYWYYNQRKKAVQAIMTGGRSKHCKIKIGEMESHFKNIFENENNHTREAYPSVDSHENIHINEEIIRKQIKRMSLDTSPGLDRVLVKTLRQLNVAKSISSIGNIMLNHSYVPNGFRNGKMILIDKLGDVNSPSNWRPLTIYSVIRRIIEKALDLILRDQISINCNQRGFVKGIPGCHINARLINACLKKAKKYKENCVVAFLDVSKAFDKIGHLHISKSLKSKGVSINLHDLIMSLLSNNFVVISIGNETSSPIQIKCSVPQGGPLSPILFNIAIDYMYEEICDLQYSNINGYKLSDSYDALCLTGFADDQAVSSHSMKSSIRTIELIQILFLKIGLQVNPDKSQAIIINNGILIDDAIRLSDGSEIIGVKPDERIRYLGCSFNSELVFDHTCIENLNANLNKLSTSSLLQPDQKLNIINQYVFPTLIYPLQTAPLDKIPSYVTNGLDVMIRRIVKEIIGIPLRTNDNLFYSPRKLRGLGLLCASWEVHLQHFAIASKLSKIDDGLFHSIYDCSAEMEFSSQALNVQGDNTKALRAALRDNAFKKWCDLKYQGRGAIHFENHTPSNDFVYNKNNLSSSEWVAAMKLSVNYANLNGVPGVNSSSNLCRKCGREIESISHVTGSCSSNNQLIIARHHAVKHFIADLLRKIGFICFVEVYGVDTDGRSRFSDIIAFDPKTTNAYIIDPTVRYETNDRNQDEIIQAEKSSIYDKTIPFYSEKYNSTFGKRNWSTIGLWFGGRGCIGFSVIDFFRKFKLDFTKLKELSELILIKTINIINQHIYN